MLVDTFRLLGSLVILLQLPNDAPVLLSPKCAIKLYSLQCNCISFNQIPLFFSFTESASLYVHKPLKLTYATKVARSSLISDPAHDK